MTETIDIALKGSVGDHAIDAALNVPASGITAIWGRSGAGKTTLLRAIAGLTRLSGHVKVAGETWQDGRRFIPIHKRRVGYIFQEPSLLPHLGVRGNLDYALRRNGGATVDDAGIIDTLRLRPLLARGPAGLSGGERQRVALARALLSAPRLLLMDEPLSSLDTTAKDDILAMIKRLTSVPILYVSHDAYEIERLADRTLHMVDGRLHDLPTADASVDALGPAQLRALAAAALKAGLAP